MGNRINNIAFDPLEFYYRGKNFFEEKEQGNENKQNEENEEIINEQVDEFYMWFCLASLFTICAAEKTMKK